MQTSSTEWIEALTERSDWVRALARSLVSDEHLADDLMQDAAVAALQLKERPEHGGWLAGTMRNLAANMSRRSARRRRREERGLRRGAEPGAAESAAFVEQQRILAEAVLALDEPFRDVVLLRFYDGLPQREIAKRLAVPKATVNSRIARALQKLRVRLDARHGGDRKAWVMALSPIGFSVNASAAVPLGAKLVGALAAAVVVAAASVYLVDPFTSGGQSALLPPAENVAVAAVDESKAVEGEPFDSTVRRELVSPASSTSIEGIRVRVVDAATGEAVPEADVRRIDRGAGSDPSFAAIRREMILGRAGMEEFYAMLPRQDLAEDATFILQQESDRVFALTPDRIGLLPPRGRRIDFEGVVLLELWPLHKVKVRIVDALGQVLRGVPVGITPGDLRVHTDELQGQASLSWSYAYSGSSGRIDPEVFLAFPLAARIRGGLTESTEQPEEITLTMPAVGSVRVLVRAGAAPVADGTLIFLSNAVQRGGQVRSFVAETRNSVAEFWPVGLGIELRAAFQLSLKTRFIETTGSGPVVEGEKVELSLESDARLVDLVGRLVDSDGAPMAEQELSAALTAEGQKHSGGFIFSTDGYGRFRHEFVVESPERNVQLHLNSNGGVVLFERDVLLPPFGDDRVVDVGDILIQAESPLISGYVLDPEGKVVSGTQVSLVHTAGNAPQLKLSQLGYYVHYQVPDAQGYFGIYAEGLDTETWLRASAPGSWYHDPVLWQSDAGEYLLELEPGGALSGAILVAQGTPVQGIHANVWLESGPGPLAVTDRWQRMPVAEGEPFRLRDARGLAGWIVDWQGRFSITSLRPGTYTFALYLSERRELLRISGVRVDPGENVDPRLTAIDLRGKIRVITLDVRDAKGVQIPATATAYLNEGRKVEDIVTQNNTRQPLLIPQADVLKAIVVRADGYFPVNLGPVEGRQKVVLSRGIPVPVDIIGIDKLVTPFSLRLDLLDANSDEQGKRRRRPSSPQHAMLYALVQPKLRVPSAGDYRVRLVLLWEENGYELHQDVNTESFPTLTISEAGAEQPFTLTLPSGAIATAMQALHKKVQRFQEGR